MKKLTLIAIGCAVGLLFLTAVVYAAEVVASPEDPAATAQALYEAIKAGQWLVAVGAGLILVVWLARLGLGKLHPWFKGKAGGWAVSMGTALLTSLGASFVAGSSPSPGLLMAAVSAAFVAAGGWEGAKDFVSWVTGKLR